MSIMLPESIGLWSDRANISFLDAAVAHDATEATDTFGACPRALRAN